MLETLNSALFIISVIAGIAFLTMFISFFYEQIGGDFWQKSSRWEDIRNSIFFKYALIFTILSFITLFSLSSYFKLLVIDEIKLNFTSSDFSKDKLYIDNIITKNQFLISSFKNIEYCGSDQRFNNKSIQLKLQKQSEIIVFYLAMKANDSTLYGVYYPKYSSSGSNCVGTIKLPKEFYSNVTKHLK